MKITRNQIIGAWLWIYKRPTMSLYIFKKYHMHTVYSLRDAKKIAKVVGDLDKARNITCSRDAWRMYKNNVLTSPTSYVPYTIDKINNVTKLISWLTKKRHIANVMIGHEEWAKHWAPATVNKIFKNDKYI